MVRGSGLVICWSQAQTFQLATNWIIAQDSWDFLNILFIDNVCFQLVHIGFERPFWGSG